MTGISPTIGGGRGGAYGLAATGATAATRFVGGTAFGAPTTGAFVIGDFVIDQSGTVWVCTVAGSPGTWVAQKSPDPLAVSLGLANWNANWCAASGQAAPTSQTIYAAAIWLPFGRAITKTSMLCGVAAAGTAITGGFMGLCSPTNMIAQSANIGTASSAYPIGPLVAPFAGSVTSYIPNPTDSPTGLYYVMLLLNGTFGSTQPQFQRGPNTNGIGGSPSGSGSIAFGTAGTGQSALPSNAAAVTLTAGAVGWVVGCL